jgi:hypothetical protein
MEALWIFGKAQATIERSTFADCTIAIMLLDGEATINRVRLVGNAAGVKTASGRARVTNSIFQRNGEGVSGCNTCSIANCTFDDNTWGIHGAPELRNSIVTRNHSSARGRKRPREPFEHLGQREHPPDAAR